MNAKAIHYTLGTDQTIIKKKKTILHGALELKNVLNKVLENIFHKYFL